MPTPENIAAVEPLLPALFASDERTDRVRLGVGLSDVSSAAMIGAVAKLRSERSRARRWVSYRDGGFVNVTFGVHAEPKDVLGAYFYALDDASQGEIFLRLSSMFSDDELGEEELRLWENLYAPRLGRGPFEPSPGTPTRGVAGRRAETAREVTRVTTWSDDVE